MSYLSEWTRVASESLDRVINQYRGQDQSWNSKTED